MSAIQNRYRELQERSKKKDLLVERYHDILRGLGLIKKCGVVDGEFQRKVNLACGLDDNVACGSECENVTACGNHERSTNERFLLACAPDTKRKGKLVQATTKKNFTLNMIKRDSMKIYNGFQDDNEARGKRRIQRRAHEKQMREKTKQMRQKIGIANENDAIKSSRYMTRAMFNRSLAYVVE